MFLGFWVNKDSTPREIAVGLYEGIVTPREIAATMSEYG
jgi:hypothetical protein